MVQTIHHTQMKKAQQMGVELFAPPEYPGLTRAFWPSHNLFVYGVDAKNAMLQMQAAIRLIENHEAEGNTISLEADADPVKKHLTINSETFGGANTPMAWAQINLEDWRNKHGSRIQRMEDRESDLQEYMTQVEPGDTIAEVDRPNTHPAWVPNGTVEMETMTPDPSEASQFVEDLSPTLNGVPTNGRTAHQKGFMTPDCPFDEGSDAAEAWMEAWEASADEAVAEAPEEKEPSGSVVKSKWRAIYAERGHPTHCGDELAIKLNNLVGGQKTNIEYFQMILAANSVDMSKYKTDGPGWQGRYRMTGRIKLAKTLHSNGGILKLPNDETLQMSQEWLDTQKFKKGAA